MYSGFFKRIFDFLFSLAVILALFFPLLIVIILIKTESSGPLFFRQVRVGKGLRTFSVYKFRTMTNEKREVGNTPIIGKAEGVTKIGYYLRRFKVDELPQLLNILNGDMSIVGPRPSIPEQLANMTDEEKMRYSVRPGLTGLAQINGNIHLQWKERFVYDLKYVKNITFINDLRIVFRTVFIVLFGEEKYLNKPVTLKEH